MSEAWTPCFQTAPRASSVAELHVIVGVLNVGRLVGRFRRVGANPETNNWAELYTSLMRKLWLDDTPFVMTIHYDVKVHVHIKLEREEVRPTPEGVAE